ncbi:MAG: GyrI-like domain-containing protein [Candidatus Paceibacterota bacterium]|jgi:effector-binding domain-containing protein
MEEIKITDLRTKLVLGMRRRGSYSEITDMIGALCQYAFSKDAAMVGSPIFICHDQDRRLAPDADNLNNADIEVVVPIAQRIEESDHIKCYELPGGAMAKMIHRGLYSECGSSYIKLIAWAKANEKEIIGPMREAYLNDPKIAGMREALTEIYAPINDL